MLYETLQYLHGWVALDQRSLRMLSRSCIGRWRCPIIKIKSKVRSMSLGVYLDLLYFLKQVKPFSRPRIECPVLYAHGMFAKGGPVSM